MKTDLASTRANFNNFLETIPDIEYVDLTGNEHFFKGYMEGPVDLLDDETPLCAFLRRTPYFKTKEEAVSYLVEQALPEFVVEHDLYLYDCFWKHPIIDPNGESVGYIMLRIGMAPKNHEQDGN